MKVSTVFSAAALLMLGSCSGNQNITNPDDSGMEALPSGNTTVIYEANPKVFSKTASIKEIEKNLDRISGDLKVNVLWLMPIYPIGQVNSVNSPYCVKDYKAVNPEYGTLEDIKSLVSAAHSKGMKVILDWVANHTAWDNAWVSEHPDWYTKNANGEIAYPETSDFVWKDVADLNYSSKELRQAMKEAMGWWVTEAGVDGFRCDYAEGVPADFWTETIKDLRAIRSDLLMLAEGSKAYLYNCGFDLVYAWTYAEDAVSVYKGAKSVSALYETVKGDMSGLTKEQNRMRYVINHDTISGTSPLDMYDSQEGVLSAFALTAFMQGVPMIYSSQEIGHPKAINFFNYDVLSWSSNKACTEAYKKIMEAYIATEKYRGSAPQLIENGKVGTVYYSAQEHKLLVMCNTSAEKQTVKVPMDIAGATCIDMITGKKKTLSSSIELGAYQYLIYTK